MLAIERSRDSRIVTLTLNRPEKRNALNGALVGELTRVIGSLAGDESVRVIILTGAGKVFSAGADLEVLQTMRDASLEENLADSSLLAELFLAIRTCPKVIIARINGHAIAGGCGLAVACDLSVATKSAKFGFTEVRIGFVPALVSVLLEDRIGGGAARELFLRGNLITSEEAWRVGLINRITDGDKLDDVVERLAEEISRNTSPQAIAATKSVLEGHLEEAFEDAARLNAEARRSSDCRAGIDAFLSRRDPRWIGEWEEDHTDPA